MTIFYHEQEALNCSKKCKLLISSALKDAFSSCRTCKPRPSFSGSDDQEENHVSSFDDEQEAIVSIIKNRALEAKLRRKNSIITDSFSSVFSANISELSLIINPGDHLKVEDDHDEGGGACAKQEAETMMKPEQEEKDEFVSAGTHFSCCSCCVADSEAFFSIRTSFSSPRTELDYFLREYQRRSIILEFCHCEGWPFGLCRKALLLPPLPKSPSESWLWHKGSSKIARRIDEGVVQAM